MVFISYENWVFVQEFEIDYGNGGNFAQKALPHAALLVLSDFPEELLERVGDDGFPLDNLLEVQIDGHFVSQKALQQISLGLGWRRGIELVLLLE